MKFSIYSELQSWPGKPYDLSFSLDEVGWLTLSWKCDNLANAAGTSYHVSRRLNGTGPFENIGDVGKKKCFDKTLPLGVRSVTYQVQAMRSGAVGEAARFDVSFGSVMRGGTSPRTRWDLRGGPGRVAA